MLYNRNKPSYGDSGVVNKWKINHCKYRRLAELYTFLNIYIFFKFSVINNTFIHVLSRILICVYILSIPFEYFNSL